MKKNLLIYIALATLSVTGFAQTVWNFSNDPFGVNGATGGSAPIDFNKNYTTADGLLVATNGTALWGLTANNKTIDGTSYTYRLQSGGGGAAVAPSKIPTTRYLKFNVSGTSTINVGMISSNSTTTRTLIIVNQDESVVDSIVNIGGATAATYTYNYPGPASSLYLYSRTSGINFYYVSATNVVLTGTNDINANKVVKSVQLYDATGKKLPQTAKGLVVKKITYDDGTTASEKAFIKEK